jgi:hypothetical protein
MSFDYKKILEEPFPLQRSSYEKFRAAAEGAVLTFKRGNKLIKKVESEPLSISDYHNLLLGIFHQVFFSSSSLSLAASLCGSRFMLARSYLIHHAEEEKDHWMWILEDLHATQYKGPDPRSLKPGWASQAYLSYGMFLGFHFPIGRLAMAAVLEGISGKLGADFAKKAAVKLGLVPDQLKFFLAHGDLDQGHSEDIFNVLKQLSLSAEEWAEMEHVALVTCELYKNIYNNAVSNGLE